MVGGSLRCLPRFLGTSRKCAMLRHHTVQQLARVGGHSVGIVVLVVFVVGAVISMQIGPLLRDYGHPMTCGSSCTALLVGLHESIR